MNALPDRKPLAIANWKMAMTLSESLSFVHALRAIADDLSQAVDIIICPPYTALAAVAQALTDTRLMLGAQNLCAAPGLAHTGEISAPLLADIGCQWVLLNHWEIRRRTGETDSDVNLKMHAAFHAGLRPILLIGESAAEKNQAEKELIGRLPQLFAGCDPDLVDQMALVYEPEWTIGVREPASPRHVAVGCDMIRQWLAQEFGPGTGERVRIIYGGSVAPEYAADLLAAPQIDGAGATRKGREPAAFAEIVRLIAAAKGLVQ